MTHRLVDAHVHFWDKSVDGLSWAFLDPNFEHPRLGRLKTLDAPRYAIDEFAADAGPWRPDKIVHVQAARSKDPTIETEWVQRLGDERGWPDAIVAYVDLSQPDAGDVVRRHAEFPRFRGIRDLPAGTKLSDPDIKRGFDLVAATGTTIEVMTSWEHYGSLLRLADRWPETPIVLGHAGLPVERDDDYFERWRAGLGQLAKAAPTMTCKISAVASGADPQWTVDSIRRWVVGCVDAFGPSRCMLASNWPVDKLFGTYPQLFDAYETILSDAGLDEAEQEQLFSETAETVYRI